MRPTMSNAEKNIVKVWPGNDVLRIVTKIVKAAERRHRPIVSKWETGVPCSSFSSSCSEIVYARSSPSGATRTSCSFFLAAKVPPS